MNLIIGASPISGRGVFAGDDIRRGEVIHRMGGRRVSFIRCIADVMTGRTRIDDPLCIGKYAYLLLDDFSVLFNHSCQANATLAREVDLVALADIPRGREITYDYSMTVRRTLYTAGWKMPCSCRAPTCRKAIGDVRSVPWQHLQRYVSAGALQDFILDSLNIDRSSVNRP